MKYDIKRIFICFGCCIGITLSILFFSFSYALFSFEEKGKVENRLITGVANTSNLRSIVLRENKLIEKEPTLTTSSNNTSDESGLYKSTDTNTGEPTYYFRGKVENNYVSFAGFMWRIVRINEDGTIRLIMQDGINSNATLRFNTTHNNYLNMYYSNSEAKTTLENWYSNNIGKNNLLDRYVATGAYYCEAAKSKLVTSWTSGNASMIVHDNYNPDFKCSNDGNGKGLVNAKIGLITYDEIIYAGGYYYKTNDSYYLYNKNFFWMMSPAGFDSSDAQDSQVWHIDNSGRIYAYVTNSMLTLRPIINLKADTVISIGTGTSSDPYVVKLNNLTDAIMSDNKLIEKEPTLTDSSNNTSDESGLYKSTDTNTGEPTYYFRGKVENNYVSFAGFMWRIVRINEDGTIRLIMQDGINSNATLRFNTTHNNYLNMYYSNSEAKTTLENWYSNNIGKNNLLDRYVATGAYYCEAAKSKLVTSWTSGNASMIVHDNYNPDFKCSNDGNGKGLVNAKIGLITYDEIIYAGGHYYKINDSYYLYNKNFFWMMSPAGFDSSDAQVWHIDNSGRIYAYVTNSTLPLRPVINLKADTVISIGTGISSDPYVIA